MTNAYKSMDIDGDGSITRRELTFLLRGMKQQVSEEMITQFIDRADTNRDGVISFDEFVNLVLKDSGIQMPDSGKLKQNINKIEVSGNRTTAKGPRYKHEPVKPEPQRHRSDKDFIFTKQYINNLQFAFYKSDKNGDGVISRKEVITFVKKFLGAPEDDKIELLVQKIF